MAEKEEQGSMNLTETLEILKKAYEVRLPVVIHGTMGCGKCLDGNSAILLPNGKTEKIKNLKVGDKVIGFNKNGKIGETEVLNTYKNETETMVINTENGNVECSPEHRFLTENRDWVRAKDLKTEDTLLYIVVSNEMDFNRKRKTDETPSGGNSDKGDCENSKQERNANKKAVLLACEKAGNCKDNRNFQSCAKKYLAKNTDGNRIGVSCGNNRRRGEFDFSDKSRKELEGDSSQDIYNEHFDEINSVVGNPVLCGGKTRYAEICENKQLCSNSNNRTAASFKRLGKDRQISDNKETAIGKNNGICEVAAGAGLWNRIYGQRTAAFLGSQKVEFKRNRICEIVRKNGKKRTFDISTSFENYIANGIVVHNSSIIKNLGQEMKLEIIDVRLSQLDSVDLRGLPKISDSNETTWVIPDFFPKEKESAGILFFDELNLAEPSVQHAAYQLILDRKLGNYELPANWVIFSAVNRAQDKANIYEIPAPLLNRFLHIEFEMPNIDEFTQYGLTHDFDKRVISFLNFKSNYLHKFNEKAKEHAFATHRSWEFCSKLIKGESKSDRIKMLATASVGAGVAYEFGAFVKLSESYDIHEIVSNPSKCDLPKEPDKLYSLVSSAGDYIERGKDKYRQNGLKLILRLDKEREPEYAMLLLKMVLPSRANLSGFEKYPEFKEMTRFLKYL